MADGTGAGPVDTEALPAAPPCDFSFFSSILGTEVWLGEDEMFNIPEMSDALIISDGTLKPVGFAIPSGVRER